MMKIHIVGAYASGKTIWITPLGEGFSDIRKRSSLLDFTSYLRKNNLKTIELVLKSLSDEAVLLKDLEYKKIKPFSNNTFLSLLDERVNQFETVENRYEF
ncbi:MAG: hypothetical protein ACQESC_02825 [Nanobdellota archaeon]